MADTLTELTEVERRDYRNRRDVVRAITAAAERDFISRAELWGREKYLQEFTGNKWLWGAAIVGAILRFVDLSIGVWILAVCLLVVLFRGGELGVVAIRLEATKQRLWELCYRWEANGLDADLFWDYGPLMERQAKLGANEAESEKWRQGRAHWWERVEGALLSRARDTTWPIDAANE